MARVKLDGDRVVFSNGNPRSIGEVLTMEDGYKQFFPDCGSGGYWATWMLREIADIVDAENAAWDAQVLADVGSYEDKE